jgi:hypothetical protein
MNKTTKNSEHALKNRMEAPCQSIKQNSIIESYLVSRCYKLGLANIGPGSTIKTQADLINASKNNVFRGFVTMGTSAIALSFSHN